jgi:hypothetical protein
MKVLQMMKFVFGNNKTDSEKITKLLVLFKLSCLAQG